MAWNDGAEGKPMAPKGKYTDNVRGPEQERDVGKPMNQKGSYKDNVNGMSNDQKYHQPSPRPADPTPYTIRAVGTGSR